MTARLPVGVFFALFTASGFAGLIYQSIWSHYLKLFLGHAAYAQTLVLAIFMGGMAAGAWLVSRFTHRIRDLLRGYAIAELGIGLLALAFHRVFVAATGWAFDSVLPALGGAGVDAFKWTLASLLILPASVLLGTTFPLMSAGILRIYPDAGGRALSMLYFTNSFGAAFGVLASGFYLIDKAGLPGTIFVAGIANVSLAFAVWLIARRMPAATPAVAARAGGPESRGGLGRVILVLAFVTGAASFIYEITWIRMLTLALGASTHSFEVMLAAFILAMSLGAFWFRNRISRLGNDLHWLAGLLVAKAVFAAWAVWIFPDVLRLVVWVARSTSHTDGGYTLTVFAGFLASTLVMFPAAFCAGMTLPLATHVLTSRGHGEAAIGRVYGANTAGCIAGAIFGTHAGMELFGVKGLTGAGAALDVAVGVLVLAAAGALRSRAAFASLAAVVAGVALFSAARLDTLQMASGPYRLGTLMDPKTTKVHFYRDGKTATISVVDLDTIRSIRTNGKSDASIQMASGQRAQSDEYTMVLAAALALAHRPDARIGANIGLGSGLTTHTLLGSPRLERLDTIEIERMVVEGARLYAPFNERVFSDPRSRIHLEDAKTYFAAAGRRYDVIVSEPSNPWVSGVSTLFSEEFYAQIRRYLTADGLFLQWVQAYEINQPLLATVFAGLGKHFGDYVVYNTGVDLLVVATPGARLPPLSREALAFPGLAKDLARLGIEGLEDMNALRVGGRAALEPLFREAGMPANSDFHPILDQGAARARFKRENASAVAEMRLATVPVLAVLDGDTRIGLDRVQRIGFNRPVPVDEAFVAAEAIGVALTGQASEARALPPRMRASALLVHGLAGDCRAAPAEWLEAAREVAHYVVPRLAGADVAPFFAFVRGARCARALDEAGRRRLEFLDATNARDVDRMAASAEWLLANARLTPAERRDCVTAVVLRGAVRKDVARMREQVEPHLRDMPLSELNNSLQLAFAHAAPAPTRPR